MEKVYNLIPINGRKSFYGKATVRVDDKGNSTLYSYNTPIIMRDSDGDLTRLWNGWSATTENHIASFCGLNKKAYMAMEIK